MKDRHVIKQFQGWNEGRVDEQARLEIQSHLGDCDDCRRYFERMTKLMEGVGPENLPHLEPDPFLPARIRAAAEESRGGGRAPRPAFGRLAASIMGATVVVAAVGGILIGGGLSSRATAGEETRALVDGYYEAFSPSDIDGEWETLLDENNGDES
jgi:anti-sigma factor RsiW